MKLLFSIILLAIPALSFAGNDKEVRPSITRNADKVKYAGNVNAGISFIGAYLNTTHGVIFPKCNIYTGGSAEYSFLWGRNFINVAADGKWFYPRKGRVQGYIGLEAGHLSSFPEFHLMMPMGKTRLIRAMRNFSSARDWEWLSISIKCHWI